MTGGSQEWEWVQAGFWSGGVWRGRRRGGAGVESGALLFVDPCDGWLVCVCVRETQTGFSFFFFSFCSFLIPSLSRAEQSGTQRGGQCAPELSNSTKTRGDRSLLGEHKKKRSRPCFASANSGGYQVEFLEELTGFEWLRRNLRRNYCHFSFSTFLISRYLIIPGLWGVTVLLKAGTQRKKVDRKSPVERGEAAEHVHNRQLFWGWNGMSSRAVDVAADALCPDHWQCQCLPSLVYLQWRHSGLPWTGSQNHAKEYPPQHWTTVSNIFTSLFPRLCLSIVSLLFSGCIVVVHMTLLSLKRTIVLPAKPCMHVYASVCQSCSQSLTGIPVRYK